MPSSTSRPMSSTSGKTQDKLLRIRFRLFYTGLLVGHFPSALWLWSARPYNTAEEKVEESLILRCLETGKTDKSIALNKHLITVIKAIEADSSGDVKAARTYFNKLDG